MISLRLRERGGVTCRPTRRATTTARKIWPAIASSDAAFRANPVAGVTSAQFDPDSVA
jgi:hypothetical protein